MKLDKGQFGDDKEKEKRVEQTMIRSVMTMLMKKEKVKEKKK